MSLHITRPVLALSLLALPSLVACGSSRPPEVVVPLATKAQSTSPAGDDPGTATVLSVTHPASFKLDGDISEWGNIVPPPPPPPKEVKGKAAPAPTPMPPSHVAIALHAEGAAIAADLSPGMGDTFWLGLELDRPEIPNIGIYMRGGMVMALPCMDEEQAARMEPEERASCEKSIDNHARFAVQYLERFGALYQIGPSGVSILRGDKLVAVPEAKIATKPSKSGATLEVLLPAKALPRTMQAPVASFFAYAEAPKGGKPLLRPDEDAMWETCRVTNPVGFAPYAELREAAFGAADMRHTHFRPYKPNNLSYQPGDGLEVEDADYPDDATRVETFTRVLYSKQATMGDVEVGLLYVGKPPPGGADVVALLSLKKGKPVQSDSLLGELKGIVERNGELHVVAYWDEEDFESSMHTAEWAVAAVDAEGKIRADLVAPVTKLAFSQLTESAAPDFSELRMMGMVMDAPPGSDPLLLKWKYDPEQREYVAVDEEAERSKPKKKAPPKKK